MALNVLFKGVYRQNDGWGLASRDYLRALSQTDCNVQAQNVFLSSHRDETVPEWIEELEKNTLTPDVIIHNVLPHTVELDHNAKNIWLGYTETGALNNSGWLPYWQNMDAVWCPTYVELNNLIKAVRYLRLRCAASLSKGESWSSVLPAATCRRSLPITCWSRMST